MNNPTQPVVSGIIVAAGNARRMLGISKQLYPIENKPVVAHTIEHFLNSPSIKELVLVCRDDEVAEFEEIGAKYIKNLPYKIVTGGKTRQESVFAGINAADLSAKYYAIHDGVRPLITPKEIEDCIKTAIDVGAATLGVKVKETIKIIGESDMIISTPERESLYSIQTPQVFEAKLYKTAMQKAIKENRDYTDDCQLIEHIGQKVKVCPGSYENVKITTREDVYIAKAIIEYREKGL